MSKIAMFTMGTQGDVQPYIFLSKQLIKCNHDVILGSHPCWRKLIEESGIKFEPIGPDIDIEKEAAIIRGKNSNPMLSMMKTMNFVFRIIQNSSEEVYKVCEGKDLIIVSHSQMGLTEAEVLGIPTVNVTLQKEMIGEPLKPRTFIENALGKMLAKQMAKPYNKIRKKYGLKSVKSLDEIMSKDLNIIPMSKYVVKKSPYWEEHVVLSGYWYDEDTNYVPDKSLVEFIEAGEKPVILALGAMSFEERSEKEKLDMFVRAFEKTGCRAVIQGFQKTLSDYELPETMIACGSVPHSWLFCNAKFVIHHCGFGTSAAAMIYGVPSIPVPHILDQLGFAMQLNNINVATAPLKSKDLSEQTIIDSIEEMHRTYDIMKQNALSVSEKIKAENGTAEAVRLIEKVIDKYKNVNASIT